MMNKNAVSVRAWVRQELDLFATFFLGPLSLMERIEGFFELGSSNVEWVNPSGKFFEFWIKFTLVFLVTNHFFNRPPIFKKPLGRTLMRRRWGGIKA